MCHASCGATSRHTLAVTCLPPDRGSQVRAWPALLTAMFPVPRKRFGKPEILHSSALTAAKNEKWPFLSKLGK